MKAFAIHCLLVFLSLGQVFLAAQDNKRVPGEILFMAEKDANLGGLLTLPLDVHQGKVICAQSCEEISKEMQIFRLRFPTSLVDPGEVLAKVRSYPKVLLAQFNHRIQLREMTALLPNDPIFPNQWALNNVGLNANTEDADIDAPEAWEINTGGISSLGDTLVLGILDDGFDLDHEDMDFWVNRLEIPGNGLDDDENGYIDDHKGWNVVTNSSEVFERSHGAHVSGIAAAKGNNGKGISGVNWNLRSIPIAASEGTEMNVVMGYDYLLKMRRRYDQSGGKEGAFVVATNASFGADGGRPSEYPLWCAIYDSMGTAGILNVVATSNSGVDVESIGDIPSLCTSEHIIAVNNSGANDEWVSSGFGTTSIDLAAPGRGIMSTFPNNSYGISTGTSMSAPHVSGAVALMYAAACPTLMALYKNDPGQTSLVMKELLLNAVDTLAAFDGRNVSGGRLNAHKALLAVQAYCEQLDGCQAPFDLVFSSITDTSLSIAWKTLENAASIVGRYRLVGSEFWNLLAPNPQGIDIQGLEACQEYEFEFSAVCGNDTSEFITRNITTKGCCAPPSGIKTGSLSDSSILVSWDKSFAISSYLLNYRNNSEDNWQEVSTQDTFFILNGLIPCSSYEFRMAVICDTGTSEFSPIQEVLTGGCGFCFDGPYCENRALRSADEWIDRVVIGPIDNQSGNDQGYANFTREKAEFVIGQTYNFRLFPGFDSFAFSEYWRIWVDYNQDGQFEGEDELVFDIGKATTENVPGEFFVPSWALEGTTRLRVQLSYQSAVDVCGTFDNGEVEDYCINIVRDPDLCLAPSGLQVIERSEESIMLEWDSFVNAQSFELRLQEVGSDEWENTEVSTNSLNWSGLKTCTDYMVQIASICTNGKSVYSESLSFQTSGCGSCVDLSYCEARSNDASIEWIERIDWDGIENVSGTNQGYALFDDAGWKARRGDSIEISLKPGFSGSSPDQMWSIWLDTDQNGEFSEDERLFSTNFASSSDIETKVMIPSEALVGYTRLRVAMRFLIAPEACGEYPAGEVEDYCVEILPTVSIDDELAQAIKVFPNPSHDIIHIQNDIYTRFYILNALGQRVFPLQELAKGEGMRIAIHSWPVGVYVMVGETPDGAFHRRLVVEEQ